MFNNNLIYGKFYVRQFLVVTYLKIRTLKERRVTPFQILVLYYFVAIVVSFILLSLPWVTKDGVHIPMLDTLFTAVSAVSVTGLTTINIAESYTTFGMAMILVILQFGAVGIMSVGTFLWLIIGKKIGMRERQLLMIDNNQNNLSGVVHLIKQIVTLLFFIEITGAIILALHFKRYFESWNDAILHGVFTSISATTNGGFDITGMSLEPFHMDYFVQFVTIVLIMLGAIGFPVLIEVKTYLLNRHSTFRFSLFTKITTMTYAVMFIVGALGIYIIELFYSFKDMAWHEAIFSALFQSASTRSAGLTTYDVTTFSEPTDVFMSFLMFIGASPSSVGGGIRTTTFAIVMLFLIAYSRGHSDIHVFNRKIDQIDINRSFVVVITAVTMVMLATIMLLISEKHATSMQIVFEITSAFGTCGMSLGITENLTVFGKCVIMLLMFVGRVGLISFLYSIGGKQKKMPYQYPSERIIIG